MTERSTHHATFVIERTYAASPARVVAAWADPAAKARWFAGPGDWDSSKHELGSARAQNTNPAPR